MAPKRKNGKSRLALADKIIEEQVEVIDDQLDRINAMLRPYEELKERANRLQAARRALLGGNRLTGAGGTRLRKEDIIEFLKDNPGSSPSQIAEKFGVASPTVSSALYRGKTDGRYLSKDGRWYLRDPKSGLDTEDDLPDHEDEDDSSVEDEEGDLEMEDDE